MLFGSLPPGLAGNGYSVNTPPGVITRDLVTEELGEPHLAGGINSNRRWTARRSWNPMLDDRRLGSSRASRDVQEYCRHSKEKQSQASHPHILPAPDPPERPGRHRTSTTGRR